MSDVLRARIRSCLTHYDVEPGALLDLDELAAELLDAALPVTNAEFEFEPIWYGLFTAANVCGNCQCTDCSCCVGCGQPDADIIGSHGSWCAL